MDPSRLLPSRAPSGPPVALPALLDRVSERWWRLPPRVRVAVVALVAVLVLAAVGRGATRSPWGAPTPVLVARSDLAPGDPVTSDALRTASRPDDLVPPDALTEPGQLPTGARVRGTLPAGTVLTARHLAPGVAGLVAPDEVALPVPRDGQPPLQAGQAVDAIVTSVQGTGTRVASDARVLAVDVDWLWVATPADRVDALAGAATSGQLVLVVRGG